MLQTAVRHSYLRIGSRRAEPLPRRAHATSSSPRSSTQALARGARRRVSRPRQVKITRLLDLRYPHQGYTLAVECPRRSPTRDKTSRSAPSTTCTATSMASRRRARTPRSSRSACRPRSRCRASLKRLAARRRQRRARPDRRAPAVRSSTPTASSRRASMTARSSWPATGSTGPAIIDQFDATTIVLAGQTATVDPLRHHRGSRHA